MHCRDCNVVEKLGSDFIVKPACGEQDIAVTTSVWCACVPFGFVLTITSTFMREFSK